MYIQGKHLPIEKIIEVDTSNQSHSPQKSIDSHVIIRLPLAVGNIQVNIVHHYPVIVCLGIYVRRICTADQGLTTAQVDSVNFPHLGKDFKARYKAP